MDLELRRFIADWSSDVLNILARAECVPNNTQCGCIEIIKAVSEKFPELNRALKNSESPRNTVQDKTSAHDSSVAVATHRSMITPRNLIQNTASQSTGSKQLQQQNTNSPRVPNKRQRALSPSFSETATDAGLPKQSFVKQKKVKPGVNPEKLRSLRSYANKDSQQAKSVSQDVSNSRYSDAMRKRNAATRQTIEFERSFIEEEDDQDVPNKIKNTNRNIFYSNPLYRSMCHLCHKKEKNLVAHYVKQHPNDEVVIARPSPAMANELRAQDQIFKWNKSYISGYCYFCEQTKTMHKGNWSRHILSHTGEPKFQCTGCNGQFKQKEKHTNCISQNFMTNFEKNRTNGELNGFMCTECNYLQINREQMVNHLTKQHEYRPAEVDQYYEMVTLLPDVSIVKPKQFEKQKPSFDIIRNFRPCIIDGIRININNACAPDSLLHILCHIDRVKEIIKFSTLTSIIRAYSKNNENDTYFYRALLLANKIFSITNRHDEITIGCTSSIYNVVKSLYSDEFPSAIFKGKCKCGATKEWPRPIIAVNFDELVKNGVNALSNCIYTHDSTFKPTCGKCNAKFKIRTTVSEIVFIDFEPWSIERNSFSLPTKITEFPIAMNIEKKEYILKGMVEFLKNEDENGISHYVAHIHMDNQWYEYNDLCKNRHKSNINTPIEAHILVYVRAQN